MKSALDLNVSRETIDRLHEYKKLINKWNSAINLVAKNDVSALWERHIMDSAQVFSLIRGAPKRWADIGSGGGLPGIVVALIAQEKQPDLKVTLVESDQRKATFLRTAIRELGITADVLADRVESIKMDQVDIVSARALASLEKLFALSQNLIVPNTVLLLLKGRRYQEEIKKAEDNWQFDVVAHPSITDKESRILEIRNLKRAK